MASHAMRHCQHVSNDVCANIYSILFLTLAQKQTRFQVHSSTAC